MTDHGAPLRVGIMPWGDVIEDYLDPIGLDLDDFARHLDEGWLFGYVAAMQAVGIESVIVFTSAAVTRQRAMTHEPTGAAMVVLPRPKTSQVLRDRLGDRAGRDWVGSAARQLGTAAATATSLPLRSLGSVIDDSGLDALIVQEYESPRFDVLVRWCRRRGTPILASFQGGNRSNSRLIQTIRSRSMRQAAHFVVPARGEIERMRGDYGTAMAPVSHIPNPVDVDRWPVRDRQAARLALGLDPDAVIFICHGRIDVHRKGLDVLVDAWASSHASANGAQLVLIGAGDGEERLEQLVASAPASIRWERRFVTDRSEIYEWLTAADVYVSSSRTEGMAVAPMEAMTASLPVILSDIPGSAELAAAAASGDGDSAVTLTPVGDIPALAASIDRLAADRALRTQLGEAARELVESRYSLASVGAQLRAAVVAST